MNGALPQNKIDTIREEQDFFRTLFSKRLEEFTSRSREIDDEDYKTLISLELAEYRKSAPSLILTTRYLLSDEMRASLIEHLSTVKDLDQETELFFKQHGISNTLSIIEAIEPMKQRACMRTLSTLLLDVVRA